MSEHLGSYSYNGGLTGAWSYVINELRQDKFRCGLDRQVQGDWHE